MLAQAAQASVAGRQRPLSPRPSSASTPGDRFSRWKGSLFIGVMKYARLERHVFNAKGQAIRREYLLEDLKQRIRDVREGPDGYLYILTDHDPGALLRSEVVES
jgi:glucose/arabinose dehydrogenase